jgi:lycopene cyclase domain-containing protein
MAEYTMLALLAAALVVAVELAWWRTGLFGRRSYWLAMGICYAFMIPVNGWFTKLSAPIVLYSSDDRIGWRFPWDIPVEDFVFGFALLTLTLLLWERQGMTNREATP